MAKEKIKLNKTELKTQKDELRQRQEFLPILELKKQQLQLVVDSIDPVIEEKNASLEVFRQEIDTWSMLLSESVGFPPQKLYHVEKVVTSTENIAGVDVPNFEELIFDHFDYDLFLTPAWVDLAQRYLRRLTVIHEELKVLRRKKALLTEELRQTTIKVNLFEKVLIPQHKDNIKKISIYLGDQEVAAISIAKIAKKKLDVAHNASRGREVRPLEEA